MGKHKHFHRLAWKFIRKKLSLYFAPIYNGCMAVMSTSMHDQVSIADEHVLSFYVRHTIISDKMCSLYVTLESIVIFASVASVKRILSQQIGNVCFDTILWHNVIFPYRSI